jgi:hypothetical protein
MATKKQMNETINMVDIIEDNMLKIEDHVILLREMITMQNKHIESINNKTKSTIIVDDKDYIINTKVVDNKKDGHLKYSRRII